MLKNLLHEGGMPAHFDLPYDPARLSDDYLTCYVPLGRVEYGEDEAGDKIKMNQAVELYTEMTFKSPKGRALVSLNPDLKQYFRDISGDVVLEPGETYTVTAKAKKALEPALVHETFGGSLGWLYRVSIIGNK